MVTSNDYSYQISKTPITRYDFLTRLWVASIFKHKENQTCLEKLENGIGFDLSLYYLKRIHLLVDLISTTVGTMRAVKKRYLKLSYESETTFSNEILIAKFIQCQCIFNQITLNKKISVRNYWNERILGNERVFPFSKQHKSTLDSEWGWWMCAI